jgi:hypothetical protein
MIELLAYGIREIMQAIYIVCLYNDFLNYVLFFCICCDRLIGKKTIMVCFKILSVNLPGVDEENEENLQDS